MAQRVQNWALEAGDIRDMQLNSMVKQLLWVLLIGACGVMLWQFVGKGVTAKTR